jgi:hypothetical protein
MGIFMGEVNAYDLVFIPFSRQASVRGLTIANEPSDLFVNGVSDERK